MPSKNTVIWADIEDSSQMALSTSELTEIVRAFKEEVLAAGFEFGLYMGKYRYDIREIDTAHSTTIYGLLDTIMDTI